MARNIGARHHLCDEKNQFKLFRNKPNASVETFPEALSIQNITPLLPFLLFM